MVAAFANRSALADPSSSLPDAAKNGGVSLLEALSLRQSTRLFADKPIDDETLSTLLWCAFGINRPNSGGHTAPSWHGAMETDIYVADARGVRKFDPAGQAAATILGRDIRSATSLSFAHGDGDERESRRSASNHVPLLPLTVWTGSSSLPIAAGLPVASMNSIATLTFGPMEPAGKFLPDSSLGLTRRSARALAVP